MPEGRAARLPGTRPPTASAAVRTAVILAAGSGRRLGHLTADRPKAMVDVDGRPLLDRAIEALGRAGIEDVVIVTGHAAEVVDRYVAARAWGDRPGRVRTLFNADYAIANNIVSFLVAGRALADGGLLLNSDVILDPAIVTDLCAEAAGPWLVVDDGRPLDDEDMKVELAADGRIRRISKHLDPAIAHGEYIGLTRFDAPGAAQALAASEALVRSGGSGLYYEDAFDVAAAQIGFRMLSTGGRPWTEVDDAADHAIAEQVARALEIEAR
jgi:choline kinase